MKKIFLIFFSLFVLGNCALFDLSNLKQTVEDAVVGAELNGTCLYDFGYILRTPKIFWTMIDASSFPLGTGFLESGNVELGNFDECLKIDETYQPVDVDTELRFQGKFCAPLIILPTSLLYDMALSPDFARESMQLSFCIPKSCGATDMLGVIENILHSLNQTVPDGLPGQLDELFTHCTSADTGKELDGGDITVLIIFVIIFALMIISTAYDVYLNKMDMKAPNPLLLAFSVFSNGKKLLSLPDPHKKNAEQLEMFHGLKFISMMWVVAGHGFVAWNNFTSINFYKDFVTETSKFYSLYMTTAPLSVDTFFFLSGFLVVFGYLKAERAKPAAAQLKSIPQMYIHRYLRLTPALLMVYLFSITLYRRIGTGPLYHSGADALRESCVNNWWSFFLYIQNYYNYDDFCLTQTWYLSADMQMFIITPFILIPISLNIRKNFKMTMYGLLAFNIFATFLPMIVKFIWQDYTNQYDTHSRIIDYSIGITLGAYMRITLHQKFKFSKIMNFFIWVFVLLFMVMTICVYQWVMLNPNYTRETIYYSLMRPMWCLSLCWIVYSCYYGYGGIVNYILSAPILQVGSRISYCMYLVHGSIVAYIVLIGRTKLYFSDFLEYYMWCGHFITTMVIAIIWALAFESPLIIIERYLLMGAGRPKPKPAEVKNATA